MLALAPGTTTVPGTGANTGLTFYLGTHHPGWLRTTAVPLFISDRRLRGYKHAPAAASGRGRWIPAASPSSRAYGSWDHGPTPRQYADPDPPLPRRDRPPGLGRSPGLDVRTRSSPPAPG